VVGVLWPLVPIHLPTFNLDQTQHVYQGVHVDQEEFQRRIDEIAIFKQVKSGEPAKGRKYTDLEPEMELEFVSYRNPTPICPGCKDTKNPKLNHTYVLENRYRDKKILKSTCPNCKDIVDIRTNTVIPREDKKAVGVYYVAKGLRTAAPGKKLGRPTKTKTHWWNEGNEASTDGKSDAERRAELLDRLQEMRNK